MTDETTKTGDAGASSSSSSKSKSSGSKSSSGASSKVKLEGEPVNDAGGHRPVVDDESGEVKDPSGAHYCPGCGLRYPSSSTCSGTAEAPHEPIDTAPVSELKGAESKHTAAPASGEPA